MALDQLTSLCQSKLSGVPPLSQKGEGLNILLMDIQSNLYINLSLYVFAML